MGLLQRLASVGLGGRREDGEEPQPESARPALRPVSRATAPMPPRPASRPAESRAPDPVSEYAKRPPHQGLDSHGRQAPVHNGGDEDHLDIPAFLRRQVN
jgi:cell division protein FtsZ